LKADAPPSTEWNNCWCEGASGKTQTGHPLVPLDQLARSCRHDLQRIPHLLAYDPYRIGLGDITLFHFFPDRFYKATGIEHQLALGMALHFCFAWFFALNGLAYVAYTLVSGEWRELLPERKSFGEALEVALHDMG